MSFVYCTRSSVRTILIDPNTYEWFADFLVGFVPHLEGLHEDAIGKLLPMLKSRRKVAPLLRLIEAWAALPAAQRNRVADSLREDFDIPTPPPTLVGATVENDT